MPVCDEKSFAFNAPAAVTVIDNQGRCPKVNDVVLPLCKVRDRARLAGGSPLTSLHLVPTAAKRGGTIFHKNAKPNGEPPAEIVQQMNGF